MKPKLMKFTLRNNEDDIIQVLAWDEDIITNITSIINSGNIVHIDGAFAKYKNVTLSSGTTQFDLTVMSNTVVRLLKASPGYTRSQNKSDCIPESTIENAVKHEGMIQATGYIRNIITETSLPNSTIHQGSISDCISHKLEVRMPVIVDMTTFSIGSHGKIKGVVKHAQYPYLWEQDKHGISLASDEKKKYWRTVEGHKNAKKNRYSKRKIIKLI